MPPVESENHVGAAARQLQGRRPANPAGSAGDDCYLAAEVVGTDASTSSDISIRWADEQHLGGGKPSAMGQGDCAARQPEPPGTVGDSAVQAQGRHATVRDNLDLP